MRRHAALCLALACGTGAVTVVDPASPSGSLDIGDIRSVPDATLRETVGGGNNLGDTVDPLDTLTADPRQQQQQGVSVVLDTDNVGDPVDPLDTGTANPEQQQQQQQQSNGSSTDQQQQGGSVVLDTDRVGWCSGGFKSANDSRVCCSATCGACGGPKCAEKEGGAANCCTADIRTANVVCSSESDAGCVIPG